MASYHLLQSFTVIFISFNTVTSDVNQPTPITVQKGHSVHLEIQDHANKTVKFDDLGWLKHDLVIVSYDFDTIHIHDSYKDRVDFNTENYALTLKNAQETDSGLYTAKADGDVETTIAQYNVTVVRSHGHGSTTGSLSLIWIILVSLFGALMIL